MDDAFQGEIPHRLPIEALRDLSKVHPWLGLFHVALEWAGIAAAIWLCSTYWHPLLYVLTVLWIGARQHALTVLMHDGAHYRIHPHKQVNEAVSEVLLAWPIFITMRSYRANHFAHHRNPNTEEDPDWARKMRTKEEWSFPMKGTALAVLLVKDLLGFSLKRLVMDVVKFSKQPKDGDSTRQPGSGAAFVLARLGLYATAAVLFTVLHCWTAFLLFWVVPVLTWFVMLLRIRSIAEHFAIEHDHPYTESRTTYPALLERLFVASKNVGYHLDHHLYPSVPFYNLPKLHAVLMESEGYRTKAHVTRTYLGVLRECISGQKVPARLPGPDPMTGAF